MDYDAPFFVREKDNEIDPQKKKNNTPLELTEKMIKEGIDKILKQNEKDKNFKINFTPRNKKIDLLMDYIDNNLEQAMHIIQTRVKIPYYLMTDAQFTKVINVFNQFNKNLSNFEYSYLTIEQLERMLKEVKNEMYVNKENILDLLILKKYNKIIKDSFKKNNYEEVKKVLWEISDIYKEYSPKLRPAILLYILKINRLQNLLEIEPFIEYIKNPIEDRRFLEQRNLYINKITNKLSYGPINIPSINFDSINQHQFIEDLLIDFFLYDKAKIEDFKNYFKQDYLRKLECISKM